MYMCKCSYSLSAQSNVALGPGSITNVLREAGTEGGEVGAEAFWAGGEWTGRQTRSGKVVGLS